MDNQRIKEMALANGFKLKEQPDGSIDLNPYVYEFALALMAEAGRAGFVAGCAYAGDGFVSIPDAKAADQYAERVKDGLA